MKEIPMMVQGRIVRAMIDKIKRQTRRVIKPQPLQRGEDSWIWKGGPKLVEAGYGAPYVHTHWSHVERAILRVLPQVGDRIWVREAFFIDNCEYLGKLKGLPALSEEQKQSQLYYAADGDICGQIPECECSDGAPKVHPAVHMPRWASRLTLEITNVRVQRLQDISEEDAWEEGCERGEPNDNGGWFPAMQRHKSGKGEIGWDDACEWFSWLWEEINGEDSWEQNPFVAAYTFKFVEPK